jgi:hypothetical protein
MRQLSIFSKLLNTGSELGQEAFVIVLHSRLSNPSDRVNSL